MNHLHDFKTVNDFFEFILERLESAKCPVKFNEARISYDDTGMITPLQAIEVGRGARMTEYSFYPKFIGLVNLDDNIDEVRMMTPSQRNYLLRHLTEHQEQLIRGTFNVIK